MSYRNPRSLLRPPAHSLQHPAHALPPAARLSTALYRLPPPQPVLDRMGQRDKRKGEDMLLIYYLDHDDKKTSYSHRTFLLFLERERMQSDIVWSTIL